MVDRKLEYMTDHFEDWEDALKEASSLSENGWFIVSTCESDEHVRIVLARETRDG